MRDRTLAKFSRYFLFLVGGFLMLFSPFAGKAQNNSTVNLIETKWATNAVIIPIVNRDNAVTTLTRHLFFHEQGKVEAVLVMEKAAGFEFKNVDEYNANTGSYEYKYKRVPTMPESDSEVWKGTYEIRGKSVYLNFPECTIEATIYSDSIKGIVTYKVTKKKEAWTLYLKQNNSNINKIPFPNKKIPFPNVICDTEYPLQATTFTFLRPENDYIWSNDSGFQVKLRPPGPYTTNDIIWSLPREMPNRVCDANGTLHPIEGYRWVNPEDPEDFRVELLPGLIIPEPGKLRPADCYRWLNPKDPDDFRVEIKTGLVKTETGCRPDKGYRWVNSKDQKDFRVERIP